MPTKIGEEGEIVTAGATFGDAAAVGVGSSTAHIAADVVI
jgi:hypothetical protein